ncbi:unnamed protein product [Brugia pahangi]|uniref:Four helix bundle protein n=1 Tax=Brugia pahangi TaxID=6280 RepID=A0A0N4TEM0_BRUPA|nr:unnamed protein product [Brugia pahangi]
MKTNNVLASIELENYFSELFLDKSRHSIVRFGQKVERAKR